MSDLRVEIKGACEVHHGSERLVVRCEGDRVVLDALADGCCVITLDSAAGPSLMYVLGE